MFLVATMGMFALVANDDDSDAGYIITSETDYVQTSKSTSFTIDNTSTDKVFCKWNLYNSSGTSQNSGTVDIASGTQESVSVSAPSTAGDYKFVVKIYSKTEKTDSDLITERQKSLKVVEPVTIKVTFENSSTTKLTFDAYLMVKKNGNWEKVDDSTKSVTVSAYTESTSTKGTGSYSFDYVARDLDRTTSYKVCSDDTVAKDISGINTEFQFYTSQNSYDFITWFLVIVLLILIIIMIWIYRKPVKNYGKPKGRK